MSADLRDLKAVVERESGVIEGEGVVTYYDPRRWNHEAHRPGGIGFIHQNDVECEVELVDCRDKTHRIHFTVYQAQYVGANNLKLGVLVRFKANPPRRDGDSPTAFRLELVEQKRERPSKAFDARMTHDR